MHTINAYAKGSFFVAIGIVAAGATIAAVRYVHGLVTSK